jgi:membrane protease YdiL (CAAX protease family)
MTTTSNSAPIGRASVDCDPPATPNAAPFDKLRERNGIRALVRRSPLLVFFVLSCLLSWGPAVPALLGTGSAGLFGAGPFVAAVVVLALSQGRRGVLDLLARMVRWRVPPLAYLAALGIPVLITAAAVAANVALGAPTPAAAQLGTWTQIPLVLAMIMLVPGAGGAWEEPGFRGFALGRLEERFGLSAAPLVLGVFWVVWHLPLFVTGTIQWPDVATIVACSVVIAAVYHSARDSILVAMLLHATNNAVGGEFASELFTGTEATRLSALVGLAWVLIALGVLAHQRRRALLGRR